MFVSTDYSSWVNRVQCFAVNKYKSFAIENLQNILLQIFIIFLFIYYFIYYNFLLFIKYL